VVAVFFVNWGFPLALVGVVFFVGFCCDWLRAAALETSNVINSLLLFFAHPPIIYHVNVCLNLHALEPFVFY
jgi:hypothetical protein